jgi:hypothetical protein
MLHPYTDSYLFKIPMHIIHVVFQLFLFHIFGLKFGVSQRLCVQRVLPAAAAAWVGVMLFVDVLVQKKLNKNILYEIL